MSKQLRPVALDFLDSAPVRLVFVQRAAAAPEAVFAALREVDSWPRWYSAVTKARPLDAGARRVIHLRGGTRFLETVIAAEEPERYAYRVDATNAPGVRAILEDWRLTPSGSGTVVRYTMAVDGTAPARTGLRLLGPGLERAFRAAVRKLDRRLAAAEADPSGMHG
ncbi:SRPBCC family protein [Streptomyces sp. N2-109]|uniref:SRPBCC family protein n=1 Tax=Streptomyces gossypii TaxID=2883101 RepID=A0ABT2JTY7_9ACTN|nr:SRPBCC family protein [Streptomyces gossypii]MCT2591343.1 SRPBCC family protein [Streptomyces gossypii]